MKTKVKIRVSRWTGSTEGVSLSIEDPLSGVEFFDCDMSFEEFGKIVSQYSSVAVDAELNWMDNIGKRLVVERRQATVKALPSSVKYDQEKMEYAKILQQDFAEPGWTVDTYLNSQGSVKNNHDGTVTLNYRVFKYVETTQDERNEILAERRL